MKYDYRISIKRIIFSSFLYNTAISTAKFSDFLSIKKYSLVYN